MPPIILYMTLIKLPYNNTALVWPESLTKPVNINLESRGVSIIPVDLSGPKEKLIQALSSINIVISIIYFRRLAEEIPLTNTTKVNYRYEVVCVVSFYNYSAPKRCYRLL
jgi:hypothetical protein